MFSNNPQRHHKYDHVRIHTVRVVSTFDLMMSCAKINGITGDQFGAKVMAHMNKLRNAYELALADAVKGEREAAAYATATICSSVGMFNYLFYVDTELDKANDPSTAVLKQYFLDIREHMLANRDDPFWDCNVIESRLPNVDNVPA